MALFRNTSAVKTDKKDKEKKTMQVEEILTPAAQTIISSDKQAAAASAIKGEAGMSYRLLRAPLVSEKAAILASKNVYIFRVPVEAEKISIAKSVHDLYGVTVIAVKTARGEGKKIYRGRKVGRRNRWKKAFVTVKAGQKIDLYERV